MGAYGAGPYGAGPYGQGGGSQPWIKSDGRPDAVRWLDDGGGGPGSTNVPMLRVTSAEIAQKFYHGIGQPTDVQVAQPIGVLRQPDPFDMPLVIIGETGSVEFDLTESTLEVDEPNAHGATKTVWASWTAPDEPPDLMRFTTAGSAADTTLAIYTGSTLGTLTPVITGDGADDPSLAFVPLPSTDYRIQIGVKGVLAPLAVLTWLPSEPATYDTFATPLVLDSTYGITDITTANGTLETGEPAVGVSATSWLDWTAATTEEVSFRIDGMDQYDTDVRVYTGSSVGALTEITSAYGPGPLVVTWVPTAGVTYHVRVGTLVDVRNYEVVWQVKTAPVVPVPLPTPPLPDDYPNEAGPALPRVHLRVAVYERDGLTLITEVPRRFGLNGQEPMNMPGSGTLQVLMDDEVFVAYPNLFAWGNIVKFWLGGVCISAFEIRRRNTKLIDTGERVARTREVSGPTVLFWLDRFIVVHDGPARPDSLEVRSYSWASRKDEWFKDSDWDTPIVSWSLKDPPSNKKKNKPRGWRVRRARWIRPIKGGGGWRYMRREFTIADEGTLVRFFATADELFSLYLDGELILKGERREVGYTEFKKYDTVLAKGKHSIAVLTRGLKSKKGDGNDSFLFAMCEVDLDGKIIRPAKLVSNDKWQAHIGNPPPGWNRALVLRNVVREARERNVDVANWLTMDFTGTSDSSGALWNDTFNQEVQIGTSALDLMTQLSEGNGFDVWMDPATMTLKAWRRRGVDKSASVALEPGRNLIDWSVDEVDEAENDFLIQYDGGWTRYEATGSVAKYGRREVYVSLNGVKDVKSAENLMRRAANGIAKAQARAGTNDLKKRPYGQPEGGLIGVEGAYPFLDFGVGDTVTAPNADGMMVKQRILALSFTEDADGNLSFDPDLEEIRSV